LLLKDKKGKGKGKGKGNNDHPTHKTESRLLSGQAPTHKQLLQLAKAMQ